MCPSRNATPARSALALAVTCVLWTAPARADFDLQMTLGVGVATKRDLPRLHTEALETSARDQGKGVVSNRGGVTMLGGRFDFGGVVDDRYVIPFLGIAAYGAVGSYPTTLSSLDGTIARIRPWTAYEIDALLPGFGVRAKKRRWMFSADTRLGVGFFNERVAVASGNDSFSTNGFAASILVDLDLEVCRRLDPEQRVCLHVTPRIYDFGVANGGTLGLTWVVGR